MARTHLSAADWSFVITKDPEDSKSRRHRRAVRSNAMRDFWRRKKLAAKGTAKRGPRHESTGIADNALLANPLLDESERPDCAGEAPANGIGVQTGDEGSDPAPVYNDTSSTNTVALMHVSGEGPLTRFPTRPILSPKSLLGSGGKDPFNALSLGDSQSWDLLHSRESTFVSHMRRYSTDEHRVQSYICRHQRQLLNNYSSKTRSLHNQGLVTLRFVR